MCLVASKGCTFDDMQRVGEWAGKVCGYLCK
jgi:hypothetical protein